MLNLNLSSTRAPAFLVALALGIAAGSAPGAGTNASATLFVPIVLSSAGAGGSFFTSELTLSNRGTSVATVELRYTSAFGGGEGTVSESLLPGEQKVIPDAIVYLRERGAPLPASGDCGGTVNAVFSGLSSSDAAAVTVRTTTATAPPQPIGAAGLAYPGIPPSSATASEATLYGLRATSQDRSNVAVYNPASEPVTLRVTVHSGDGSGSSVVKEEAIALSGFGWQQLNAVFDGTGITHGWVSVERTGGSGVFGAYAVVNCNGTSDGSFVPATVAGGPGSRITVPVLVETTSGFVSELVLANRSASEVTLTLSYVESLATTPARGTATVKLRPREQRILPDALEALRGMGIPIGAKGQASYAGTLRVTVAGAPMADVFAGARTASLCPAGGQFGLFTPGVYAGQEASTEAFLHGLKADALNRTNVALLHAGNDGSGALTLELQAYDGDAGGLSRGEPELVTLEPGGWYQSAGFLGTRGVRNGWVRVTRLSGTAPWIAYGVVNDGGIPGERTGDGAYVSMATGSAVASLAWEISVVPDTDVAYVALDYDREGRPAIAYSRRKTESPGLTYETKLARHDPGASAWVVQPVAPDGYAVDLAFDRGNGSPTVGYWAYTKDLVEVARWNGSAWEVSTIDGPVGVNERTRLVHGPDGMPSVCYRSKKDRPGLRFARWSGSAWVVQEVDTGPVGSYSLAYDPAGNPAIAYGKDSDGDGLLDVLKLARRVGSAWEVRTVESGRSYGTSASLAFDGAGQPSIAHWPPFGDARFVRWDGATWVPEVISTVAEGGGVSGGSDGSLAYDASGTSIVSFCRASTNAVLARRTPTGVWKVEVVDQDLKSCYKTDLRIDPDGNPSLAYVGRTTTGSSWAAGFARLVRK